MVAVVFAVPFVVILTLVVVALSGSQGRALHTVYPGPDRNVSLIVETDATGSDPDHAHLAGQTFSDRAEIGAYDGDWTSGDGWTDAVTFDICNSEKDNGDRPASKTIVLMRDAGGVDTVFRLVSRCPTGHFESPAAAEARK